MRQLGYVISPVEYFNAQSLEKSVRIRNTLCFLRVCLDGSKEKGIGFNGRQKNGKWVLGTVHFAQAKCSNQFFAEFSS